MATAGKARETLLLLSYVSFTLGNMLLGLLQMTNLHRAGNRSNAVWHWLAPSSYAGGSAMVSQPPTPTRRAWPVILTNYHVSGRFNNELLGSEGEARTVTLSSLGVFYFCTTRCLLSVARVRLPPHRALVNRAASRLGRPASIPRARS